MHPCKIWLSYTQQRAPLRRSLGIAQFRIIFCIMQENHAELCRIMRLVVGFRLDVLSCSCPTRSGLAAAGRMCNGAQRLG